VPADVRADLPGEVPGGMSVSGAIPLLDDAPPPEVEWIASAIVRDAASSDRPVVLIDGRSGSGKTILGALLADALEAQLVRLDDIYPGWGGLAAASRMVVDDVLLRSAWTRWDWQTSEPAERHTLDRSAPLIVEGCGAISRGSMPFATTAIWVELDAATRRRRALARDGETYRPYWELWAAQEEEHLALETPERRAALVLSGTDFSRIR